MELNKNDGRLVLLGEDNSGRDEMNLAGNPFALLQAASKSGQTQIIREFEREMPSGQLVKARWKVEGDQELGLPGPNEALVYLVLLQITRESADENGVWPQKVSFSRADVIERLGWPLNGNSYKLLRDSMVRLTAVTIVADNAFWDAATKTPFKTVTFHILGNFGIADEPKSKAGQPRIPLSWMEWDKIVYQSFLAGNVRSLALDFIFTLKTPVGVQLFRVLDVLRKSKKPPLEEVKFELFDLRDRLGMTPYPYPSKIQQTIRPGVEELKAKNYLESVTYSKDGKNHSAVFKFVNPNLAPVPPKEPKAPVNAPQEIKTLSQPSSEPSDREIIAQGYEIWQKLSESERKPLLDEAKTNVQPIFHDRLINPDSPFSLELFKLAVRDFS